MRGYESVVQNSFASYFIAFIVISQLLLVFIKLHVNVQFHMILHPNSSCYFWNFYNIRFSLTQILRLTLNIFEYINTFSLGREKFKIIIKITWWMKRHQVILRKLHFLNFLCEVKINKWDFFTKFILTRVYFIVAVVSLSL